MHMTPSTDDNNLFIHLHTKQIKKWKHYDDVHTITVLSRKQNYQSIFVKKQR